MTQMQVDVHWHDQTRRMAFDLDENDMTENAILSHLRAGQYYEPDMSLAMLRLLRPGDTAIDVGANVGFFTILSATLVGSEGRVIAAEPGETNLAKLRRNIALNDLKQVEIIEQPISDSAAPVTFYINSDNSGGNALWNPGAFPSNAKSRLQTIAKTIPATTLDREIARLGYAPPRLIKIDTEGAELKVLEGARGLLAGRKVPYVLSELNGFGLAQMGTTQGALRAYMEGLGYSTFMLFPDATLPKLVPPRTILHCRYIRNVLFSTVEAVGEAWPEEMY